FTVNATDSNNDKGTQNYTLTVNAGAITINPTTLPTATTGTAYNQTLTAAGGTGALTVSDTITSTTTPLDLGLTFATSGNQLVISVTPTASGSITFSVTATDGSGNHLTQNYTLNVQAGAISFSPIFLPTGFAGTAYNQTVTASGGTASPTLRYAIISGSIPAGLSFTVVNNQLLISGTPTSSGGVSFTVTATDPAGHQGTQYYTLTINAGAFTFSPATLPAGTAGTAYNQTITATGGSGTVTTTYTVTSGSIPAGLTFTPNVNTLTISGTPTVSGTVSFTVIVTDTNGDRSTQNYTLTVNPVQVSPPPPPPLALSTISTIVSVQNQYPGLVQVETVTVDVTNPNGYAVDEGYVTLQVDGQTVYAPVINGVATATVATSLFDFGALFDLFFAHSLTVAYNDGSGNFGPSSASTEVPSILLDFFTFLIAEQYQQLTQYQVI
ncbi:MAG: putative Ig domain-containing protein, partial [Solirubrobacteraceae bacterium]